MRQKKKEIGSVKKKSVKRAKLVKSQKKLSKNVLFGIVIIFISLFVIVAFSSHQQILRGNAAQTAVSPVVPTFVPLGDCTSNQNCPTGSGSGGEQTIVGQPASSTTPPTAISPTSNPAV